MKPIKHTITHHFQPTNNTCGYGALATFLSHYDHVYTPQQLVDTVPQPVLRQDGTTGGSVTAQLATYYQTAGLNVTMYTFDCLITDLSWKNLSSTQTIERLSAVRNHRDVLGLGKNYANVYIDAYIALLKAGAKLNIQPYVTTDLLHTLLQHGPVFTNICSTTLRGVGRSRPIGLRKSVVDDIAGSVSTHSTVVCGIDTDGSFLVSDPNVGLITVQPDALLCAITAAQIECDNQLFVALKV